LTIGIAPQRGKPRWLILLAVVSLCFGLLPALVLAGDVGTASGFQDDDGNLIDDGAGIDWNSFDPVSWQPSPTTTPNRQADKVFDGWTFKGIEDWQATTADSAFAGGTKQDDECASVITGKAPNKDDLKRIYLSSKVISGKTYLNLAWVRIPQNTTSPSAHIGFEFNKGDEPCGTDSDGLVERTLGDMLIVYDFEGGATDTPTITLRRWVTSGSCEVGSSDPPCWGPATNLTALGFAEAKVNTTTTALDALSPPALNSATGTSVDATLGISEFGEAGIDLTGAGVFTAGSCESFGKAFGVSRSSGNSGTAQMKDLVGPADFQLANCGTVIIHKETSPDEDPNATSFGYTTNVTTTPSTTTSPFSLMDDGTKTILNVNQAGGLHVTEDDPGPAYALTSIDCSASTVPAANYSTNTTTRAVTFSIGGGETLECTFTNTLQVGALKIIKQSTKTGNPLVSEDGAVFSYEDANEVSSSVTDNGTGDEDSDVGEVCVSGVVIGTYTVNETSPPDGYGDASQTDQSVTVVAGTNCTDNLPGAGATATFTNPPLSDIQVRFRDGGSGETSIISMTCDNATGASSTTDTTDWDDTLTITGIEAPTTIECTIDIDP
jgi:hypothetical protein